MKIFLHHIEISLDKGRNLCIYFLKVNEMLRNSTKKDLYRINITALAKRIGRTRTWVSLVLNGHEKSPVTRGLIASALGVRIEELWPNSHKKAA
jgi:lambda repressor-like predicted transcriptional regulator